MKEYIEAFKASPTNKRTIEQLKIIHTAWRILSLGRDNEHKNEAVEKLLDGLELLETGSFDMRKLLLERENELKNSLKEKFVSRFFDFYFDEILQDK